MRKLSNWIDSYVAYTKKNEAPDLFHLWCAVWILSAAVGRKAWLEWSHFTDYVSFYIVLVGPPASRKTTACNIARKAVDGIESIHLGPNITSIEALIAGIPDFREEFTVAGKPHEHSSIALVVPEWTTLTGEKDVPKCTTLCSLYDADDNFNKWTKSMPRDSLKNYFVTMIGGSTAKYLVESLPQAAIGGGLTSRILFIVSDEDRTKRNALPRLSKRDLDLRISLKHDLENISKEIKGEFKISKEAEDVYINWYENEQDQKLIIDENFEHYYNRKPDHIRRLAMILSVAEDNSMQINASHILRAIELLNIIEPRMPEALGGIGTSVSAPIIHRIKTIMKKEKKLSQSKLQGRLWQYADADELDRALRTVFNWGIVVRDKGRPTDLIWKGGK